MSANDRELATLRILLTNILILNSRKKVTTSCPTTILKRKKLDEEARKMRKLFVGVLNDIYDRMNRLNPDSYETNGQSDEGGEKLFCELEHLLQELDVIEL